MDNCQIKRSYNRFQPRQRQARSAFAPQNSLAEKKERVEIYIYKIKRVTQFEAGKGDLTWWIPKPQTALAPYQQKIQSGILMRENINLYFR